MIVCFALRSGLLGAALLGVETAVDGADVVAGGEVADGGAVGPVFDALAEQFADHLDEQGMRAYGGNSDHADPEFLTGVFGFGVEIEENFHVIADEAEWNDGDVGDTFSGELFDAIAHIGLEPRLLRRTAAALEDKFPALRAHGGGD